MLKELKRVFKDSVIYGLGSLLPKAAGIILLPVYTRFMSPADYGLYSLSMMIASMVGVVMLLGQHGSLVLHLRRRQEGEGDPGELLFTVVIFVMSFAAVLFGVLYAFGPVLTPLLNSSSEFSFSPYVVLALTIAYLGLPLAMLQSVNRAKGQAGTHTSFQLAQFALNTLVTLYFVVVLHQGAVGSLKGTLFAAAIIFPVALFVLARQMKARFSLPALRRSLKFGLPLVPHYFAGWLLTFADRAMLGRLASLEAVGLYSVAYNISMVLNLFSTAINQAWTPIFYDLSDTEEGRKVLPRLTTVYASAVAALAIGFTLFASDVLVILTAPTYWDAKQIVPLVACGYFFFALYTIVSTPIFYARKTWYMPMVSGGAAVFNIAINFWLIPAYGIMGAAVATAISYMLMAAVARYMSGWFRKDAFEDGRLARVIVIYLLSLAVSYGFLALDWPLYLDIIAKAVAYVLLLSLFIAFGVATRGEFEQLWARLRRRGKAGAKPTVAEEVNEDAEDAAMIMRADGEGGSPDASGFDPDSRL